MYTTPPLPLDPKAWKPELDEFRAKTDAFYAGQMEKAAYKGFSGYFGSYAQRGAAASMLRLRMPAGRVSGPRLAFVADVLRRYQLRRLHFTTCQTIQLHDLAPQALYAIMEAALEAGIVVLGGGGDYPRNVMCSPLAGADPAEYWDVTPWAEAAGAYLLRFLHTEKMPRKLKVGFSSSPQNLCHATYRDLGFAAREDGLFDVYSAGGLGNNPKLGVKVAEGVAPDQILYYIKAMWLTFRAYGNYENRAKARTRYMQEALGGPEAYAAAFRQKLSEVYQTEDLTLTGVEAPAMTKTGVPDESLPAHPRVLAQKQPGLYAVAWHPIGGMPDPAVFCQVSDALQTMQDAELRLSPDEGAYLVNLNAEEARTLLAMTEGNTAHSLFETSVACIGAGTCRGCGIPRRCWPIVWRLCAQPACLTALCPRSIFQAALPAAAPTRPGRSVFAAQPRCGTADYSLLLPCLRAVAAARATKSWAGRSASCCGKTFPPSWLRWVRPWPPPGRITPPGTPPTPPPLTHWPRVTCNRTGTARACRKQRFHRHFAASQPHPACALRP